MTDKQPMPPAGIFLGRRFDPEIGAPEYVRSGDDNDDVMTSSEALRETLEGQGKDVKGPL